MTAFLVFTETQPLVVVASRAAVTEGRLVEGLTRKGIGKFMAHEVPLENLRSEYGVAFELIEADILGGKDIRVLDSNGGHVFAKIQFANLGQRIEREFPAVSSEAGPACGACQ